MRFLIVEDDPNKSRQLREFVQQSWPAAAVEEKRSYQSGLAALVQAPPDVVLLDMTMPTFDRSANDRGGRTRFFAGRDILREMRRRFLKAKTIVVTGFESFGEKDQQKTLRQLTAELKQEFPETYVGTVYYHPSRSDWKVELQELLDLPTASSE